MRNPWVKKNPLLSMWLSGANTALSVARSRAMTESKRQATAIMRLGAKQIAGFWGCLDGTAFSEKEEAVLGRVFKTIWQNSGESTAQTLVRMFAQTRVLMRS